MLLAMLFSWMLILPVFARATASNVPVCCRKTGKHKCMMGLTSPQSSGPAVSAMGEKCPCSSPATVAAHVEAFQPSLRQASGESMTRHAAMSFQTEANYRSSHLRSRQKRGPPVRSSLKS